VVDGYEIAKSLREIMSRYDGLHQLGLRNGQIAREFVRARGSYRDNIPAQFASKRKSVDAATAC